MVLTVKGVWSDRLCKSGTIVCVLSSFALAQRNIKLITKLELLELSAYLIRSYIVGIDNSRLNESGEDTINSSCYP